MVTVIPENLKNIWNEWNLRASVLFSLLLQIFLIFSATFRKRRGTGKLTVMVWLAYLLADWIAAFAVGLISSGVGSDCDDDFKVNKSIAAFWAPFLLLHLGGPDTITAFSLEDNELWIRHLFGLLIQFVAVLYVFLQSLPNDLWLPTLLVLIAGTIKYAERTRALYVACLGNFKDSLLPKPDAGPNYAQLMEEYSSREAANVPVNIDIVTETDKGSNSFDKVEKKTLNKTNSEVVKHAYEFYRTFRGLIVDHMLGFQERDDSRNFFFQRTAEDAFRVMEIELNFIYDELYTKMAVVHHTILHYLRVFCSVLVVVSLWQFASHHKHRINRIDIDITYTLLVGALVLDIIAHFKLIVSDWTIATWRKQAERIVSPLRKNCSFKEKCHWSNTIWQHSLIYYCLDQRLKWIEKIIEVFGLKSVLDEWRYKRSMPLEPNVNDYKRSMPLELKVKDFIFNELESKAKKAENVKSAKEICSARGEYTLLDYPCQYGYKLIARSVSEEVEFDESILLWHIATELCYYTEPNREPTNDTNPHRELTNHTNPNRELTNHTNRDRERCKLLSEYMLYLLIMRPTIMSAVAGIAQIRFQDTCEEAKKFFSRGQLKPIHTFFETFKRIGHKFKKCFKSSQSDFGEKRSDACSDLLKVNTVVKPSEVKGDRSKSVLFDACMLAQELQELDESKRWEMMSKVWVELLCYAASHCRASSHAQLLSKGGELVTFVWLLMAHFGLGDQFRIQAGHARAKLIVSK